MPQPNMTNTRANEILSRARSNYEQYRAKGNLDRNGQARPNWSFSEEPRPKTQRQLEREIVGYSIDLGPSKPWKAGNEKTSGQAIKQNPRLSLGASRDLRIVSPTGMTTINFRVASLSKTSKRHTASERWHSADHTVYMERDAAVAIIQLEVDAGSASAYIERCEAVSIDDGDVKAIFSNISTDPDKRRRFWEKVEACETEGGENELVIDLSVAGTLATSVASDEQCPEELKRKITKASPNETIRHIGGDPVALRHLFSRNGWTPPEKGNRRNKQTSTAPKKDRALGTPGIKFHDARAGRTQIQSNGEIPAELSLKGKARICERLHDHFKKRSLPVTVVLHAPDYKNNEKNWHFHFAAYERPCQRFDNKAESLPCLPANATSAEKKAHAKRLKHIGSPDLDSFIGEWDFAVPVIKRTSSRNYLTSFPFRQNKDRSINHDDFPVEMRKLLVKLCNEELEREGFPARYDPQTYKLMGISKEPDEHLGKNAAQLEKYGIPTETGIANEEKQWAYIIAKLDREHTQGLKNIDSVYDKYSRLEREKKAPDLEKASPNTDHWRSLVYTAQNALRVERELEQLIERAKSRAARTAKACRASLDAVDSGHAAAGDIRNRDLFANRLHLAEDHLAGIDVQFRQEAADIEYLRRQRTEAMQQAKQALKPLIEGNSSARSTKVDTPPENVGIKAADRELQMLTSSATSAVEALILAFRDAKTDEERRKSAATIRMFPAALEAMNKHGGEPWILEQRKFADLQRAQQSNLGRSY